MVDWGRVFCTVGVPIAIGVSVTIGVGALLGVAPIAALGAGIVGGGGLAAFAASSIGSVASGVAGYLLRTYIDLETPKASRALAAGAVALVAGTASLGVAKGVGALLAPVAEAASARVAGVLADTPALRAVVEKLPGVSVPVGQRLQVLPDTAALDASLDNMMKRGSIYQATGDFFMNVQRPAEGEVHYVLRPSFNWLLAGRPNLEDWVLRTQARQDAIVGAAIAEAAAGALDRAATSATAATARSVGIAGALDLLNDGRE